MRVLLVALNAKYVHTNLALRYLRSAISPYYPEVLLREFSINDRPDQIAGDLYKAGADVIGFSCYIWNISEITALLRRLRPVCPQVKFVLGGPEVSFEAEEFLREHPEVDALVLGEGEKTFLALLKAWENGDDLTLIQGVAWRKQGEIPRVSTLTPALPDYAEINALPPDYARTNTLPPDYIYMNTPSTDYVDMNALPDPYTEQEDFSSRLVYVETTRGCPFHCQFCLSSALPGVRFMEPERFRPLFRRLLENGARTVKFVDRTFNASKKHAMAILDIVREESAKSADPEAVRVHCEMAGDLLDDEWMAYLRRYPPGLLQMELGVQSTNPATLKRISRSQNFAAWQKYIKIMQDLGIHLHLDLIVGLPEEDWLSIGRSFNDVYAVQPDRFQFGFLKVLKGSGLRLRNDFYRLTYMPDPPYMILGTPVLSHGEILQLHQVEELLDMYYNSGKFKHSLRAVLKLFPAPFEFYAEYARYWEERGWFSRKDRGKVLFDKLWDFAEKRLAAGTEEVGEIGEAEETGETRETGGTKETGEAGEEIDTLSLDSWLERIRSALRFDYYLWERPRTLPSYLQADSDEEVSGKTAQEILGKTQQKTLEKTLQKTRQEEISRQSFWENLIPELRNIDRREWTRNTAVAYFSYDVRQPEKSPAPCWYLFRYRQGKTEVYRFTEEVGIDQQHTNECNTD